MSSKYTYKSERLFLLFSGGRAEKIAEKMKCQTKKCSKIKVK